jgi:hypothetical protein
MTLKYQTFKGLLHHTDGVVVQDNNDAPALSMPMYFERMIFVG